MAIVKLVCQGCGANLDALSQSPVIRCGYCGTNNQIKQTFQPTPPPPQYAPPQNFAPPKQPVFQGEQPATRSGMTTFVVLLAVIPLVIGGVITWFLARSGIESFEQFSQKLDG